MLVKPKSTVMRLYLVGITSSVVYLTMHFSTGREMFSELRTEFDEPLRAIR